MNEIEWLDMQEESEQKDKNILSEMDSLILALTNVIRRVRGEIK